MQPNRRMSFAPSARDFRYESIAPGELPSIMRRHIFTGTMGTVYGTLTTGMFLVAFGGIIGMSVVQWGVLSAVCSFAIATQLLSAYAAAKYGYRRLIWFAMEGTSRLLRTIGFGLAFLFFFSGRLSAAAFALVLLLSIASFFAAAGTPPWFSWLADIIPERLHGGFMGRRDAWISLGTLAVVLPVSYWLDLADEDLKSYMLAFIFGVGILLGMVDLFMHRIIPEPHAPHQVEGTFKEQVLAPLRDREYRPWLIFSTAWTFALMLGGSLALIFFVEDLRIRDNYLAGSLALIAVPLFATMVTSRWSGSLVDRLGVRRVLAVSHFLMSILPIFWIVAVPRTALFWLTVSSALAGAAFSAATNAGNKLITRFPPRGQNTMYLAVTACVNNIAGGLGALAAGYFLAGLEGHRWLLWNRELVPFHLLFAVTLLCRLGSWLLVFRIKTPSFDLDK